MLNDDYDNNTDDNKFDIKKGMVTEKEPGISGIPSTTTSPKEKHNDDIMNEMMEGYDEWIK